MDSYATGCCNIGIGQNALNFASFTNTNFAHTAVGHNSLRNTLNTTGNTAIGTQSLFSNTTASCNTAVGYLAACSNTTGSNNSVLGSNAQTGNFSCSVILGACATATGNNQFVVGGTGAFNAGTVTTESNSSTKVWNVVINGVAHKILLA
jgi:hypothetical protein